jgi:hypothetical protein
MGWRFNLKRFSTNQRKKIFCHILYGINALLLWIYNDDPVFYLPIVKISNLNIERNFKK